MRMGLSLNPADIWKIFADRGIRDKDRIVAWLEWVCKEADSLSRVWTCIVGEFGKGRETVEFSAAVTDELKLFRGANGPYYTALMIFYRDASSVIGGRMDKKVQNDFIHTLSTLLYLRNLTQAAYVDAIRKIRSAYFLEESNQHVDLTDLATCVDVLSREAAALRVILENFRASK
ncbi:MAG: hypothetical protein ABSA78_02405 [Candidatus Sulfotelmatobacter sp.]|jgi:hypothetical protein